LRDRAEAEARSGNWPAALEDWRAVNRTRLAGGRTYLAEARACLSLHRAAQAERALRRAIAADPADPEPWRLLLELLRVEDRTPEAQELGWEAYAAVPQGTRRGVLSDLTLALLADLPDDVARPYLDRWTAADPEDTNARVALLRRIASMPRSGDPDRDARIAQLTAILDHEPAHLGAREALIAALADAGEPDRGRQLLDAWPAAARDDLRLERLKGRWDLDYDRQPARAVDAFRRVLAVLPHDWRTQYGLARALARLGRVDEATRAAESVGKLRENLDPATLGPRLGADLARLEDYRSLADLSSLCGRVGLTRLAEAWRQEAAAPAGAPGSVQSDLGILDSSIVPNAMPSR
jgi:Flp pilus assembly protein TadD